MRQLDTATASKLSELVETFEELQVVLQCCERLMAELDTSEGQIDEVVVEALWTTALQSYARCFTAGDGNAVLSDQDLTTTQPEGDVLGWHRILLQLRDHHAHPTANPREQFYVCVAQDERGAAAGVAVTSTRQPLVDDITVRQTGAIAFGLSRLVNDRVDEQQEQVFSQMKDASPADLDKLRLIDVEELPARS